MRKKQFSHRIASLDSEKKVIAITNILSLVACFLPWYGINSRVINEWWNAFSSIGSVAGYMIALFSLVSLGIIFTQVLKPEWDVQQKLFFKESSVLFFLGAQSVFVTLMFIPVYAQYSLINASNSGTRFGIYVALVSSLVTTIVSLAYLKRMEKSGSMQKDFASMPRTHRAVDEWGQEETENTLEEIEQETMFDQHADINTPHEFAGISENDQENEYNRMK